MGQPPNHPSPSLASDTIDLCVTLVLWTYFIFGFLVFFLTFYLLAYFFATDREAAFQRLNHIFYKGFLGLVKFMIPRHTWRINEKVPAIRSSVIICNHVSYLDPLIMIALFSHHKTIVKARFFQMPIFGWLVKSSGYIPATTAGPLSRLMIEQVAGMREFLAEGGNLFIFPEGTRSRTGHTAIFNQGAFKIARLCQAPIQVLHISNTEVLFPPGRFLFNSRVRNQIGVDFCGTVHGGTQERPDTVAEMMRKVQTIQGKDADL
jgi:1-acyl-sn-glycerol-3-phosphate acyltransferase